MRVAILTDNDFAKVNGVTTTLRAVVRHAPPEIRLRIYTFSDHAVEEPAYLALTSRGTQIPFYPDMQMYWPGVRQLSRCLTADGVELVHVTTAGPMGLAAKYLAARLALPVVGSFHSDLARYATVLSGSASLGSLMNVYMRWLYGRCHRLLVPSEDTMARLQHAGWNPATMAVWPRGVDIDRFSPSRRSAALREAWGVSDRRLAVLYVGRLSREKGLSMLSAIETLLPHRRIRARLIVAGDGPMAGELRDRCPGVLFLGRLSHDQVAEAMASADVFLFPSDTDTAGNVVLEAQASGLPVLVSRLGGPREQMVDGETGFVCEAGDPVDFARRAGQVLTEPDRRKAMSRAARDHARARTWGRALEPLFACYRSAAVSGTTKPLTQAGTEALMR